MWCDENTKAADQVFVEPANISGRSVKYGTNGSPNGFMVGDLKAPQMLLGLKKLVNWLTE